MEISPTPISIIFHHDKIVLSFLIKAAIFKKPNKISFQINYIQEINFIQSLNYF